MKGSPQLQNSGDSGGGPFEARCELHTLERPDLPGGELTPAWRANSAEELNKALAVSLSETGPSLIEAMI